MAQGSWWLCNVAATNSDPRRCFIVSSTRYPDGTRLTLAPDMARTQVGEDAICVITIADDLRVTGLEVTKRAAPKAPPMWFTEVRESSGRPPAVSLLAFTGHGQPTGTLVDESGLPPRTVTSADQLGAVRWYPASGEVDQIYVQPGWRRLGIGTALLTAAGSLSAAREWPRLWGDGQRTQHGEDFRNAATWRHRAAELTHLAPPMTPSGQ